MSARHERLSLLAQQQQQQKDKDKLLDGAVEVEVGAEGEAGAGGAAEEEWADATHPGDDALLRQWGELLRIADGNGRRWRFDISDGGVDGEGLC